MSVRGTSSLYGQLVSRPAAGGYVPRWVLFVKERCTSFVFKVKKDDLNRWKRGFGKKLFRVLGRGHRNTCVIRVYTFVTGNISMFHVKPGQGWQKRWRPTLSSSLQAENLSDVLSSLGVQRALSHPYIMGTQRKRS